MPRLYSPVDSRQACTRRIFWPISQSRRWRHPAGEFAKLLVRTLLQLDMLASSVFLETSIPNIPSITVLSFHLVSSARAPLRTPLCAESTLTRFPRYRPIGTAELGKSGPNLPHGLIRQRDARGSPFSLPLSKCVYLLDASYLAPPAQSRTGPIRAYGSHLGCLTAKRASGQG